MIDKKSLQRARHIKKCAAGSQVDVITNSTKQAFARANGLKFENGKFFSLDGNLSEVEIADDDILGWKGSMGSAIASGLSQVASIGRSMLAGTPNVQNQSPETLAINAGYDTAADVVSSISPTAGGIMKLGAFASDAMTSFGIGTDQATTTDKILDSTVGKMLGVGVVNALGASESDDFAIDTKAMETVGGSLTGAQKTIRKAKEKAGKQIGLFNNKQAINQEIAQGKKTMDKITGISNEVTDQRAMVDAMGDLMTDAYKTKMAGGIDPRYLRPSAKQGGKLEEEFVPEIIEALPEFEKIVPSASQGGSLFSEKINPTSGQIEEWEPELIDVSSFKPGGRIEKQLDAPEIEESSQKNLIPEGALHKNKHHMENAEDLTKKGIPVVDDEHQQQAEIECNEIIFTKEVTTKLEELYHKFYDEGTKQSEKDELAIMAGKLLTKEIMLNTDDRTGLIDTLKNGGVLEPDKPEFKEWLATVPAKWINDNYDLETAYKVLPFSKLEQWRLETLKEKQSEGDEWHLPSVYQADENTYIWLKKGKTVKQNPELQGEIDFYTSNPEFNKTWKMKFDKEANRWTYVRRKPEKSE